jgi:Tfp pilus assembly protein PilO
MSPAGLIIKEKDKQIALIILFAIIIAVDLAIVLGWQYRLFSKNNETLVNKKKMLNSLENDLKNLDKTTQEIGDMDAKINMFYSSMVEEKNISTLIEDISNLANLSGVKITQIRPITDNINFEIIEAKDSKFNEIEIQIVGKANFHQFGNFINRIESAKTFYKVDSFEIEADAKDYNVQNIRLSLRTYVNII